MKIVLLTLAILIVVTSNVLAFEISQPYWNESPLEMYPGQTKDVMFNLQNCQSLSEDCDKEGVEVIVELEEGEEIAEIINGPDYFLPFGSTNQNIIVRIIIPASVPVGTEYNVKFVAISIGDEESLAIQIENKYDVEFPVIIVAETEVAEESEVPAPVIEEPINWFLWVSIAIIIILIVITIVIILSKKNKNDLETLNSFI